MPLRHLDVFVIARIRYFAVYPTDMSGEDERSGDDAASTTYSPSPTQNVFVPAEEVDPANLGYESLVSMPAAISSQIAPIFRSGQSLAAKPLQLCLPVQRQLR